MSGPGRNALFFAAFAATFACARDPGTVELLFQWQDRAPADQDALFFTLRIEERIDAARTGPVLGRAGPAHLSREESIETPLIPNGQHRVAITELRRSAWTNDQVLFYGLSKPFSIEPGKRVTEAIVLRAGPPPYDLPPPPERPKLEKAVFERVPFGSDSTKGAPRFSVIGSAGAARPGSQLVVFSGREATSSAELARGPVLEDGSFRIEVRAGDQRDVYAATLDPVLGSLSDAGPEPGIQAEIVRRGSWIGALSKLVSAGGQPNPIRISKSPRFLGFGYREATRAPETPAAPNELGALAARDGESLSAQSKRVWASSGGFARDWAPGLRARHAMAYDFARSRMVLFGGNKVVEATESVDRSTWEWDGDRWTEVQSEAPLTPEARPRMAYAGFRERVVMTSTAVETGKLAMWEWDGSTWVEIAADEAPVLTKLEIAYDGWRGKLVVFGDTGVFEWGRDGWTQVFAGAAPRPGPVAYDEQRRRMVMISPAPEGRGFATFEWDGTSFARISDELPFRNELHLPQAIAFDRSRGRVAVVAKDPEGRRRTFEWDGRAWTNPASEREWPTGHVSSGPVRNTDVDYAVALDGRRNRLLLVGGQGQGVHNDASSTTLERVGLGWRIRSFDGSSPRRRAGAQMAYDEASESLLLFGTETGSHPLETGVLSDHQLWLLEGSTWRYASFGLPARRDGFAFAYDAGLQRVLLFGGRGWSGDRLNDLWQWSLARGFLPVASEGHRPSPRAGAAMAHDSDRNVTVLFGGIDDAGPLRDTWEWLGDRFKERIPEGLEIPGSAGPMVYDAARKEILMLIPGGELWSWNGRAWRMRASSSSLPAGDSSLYRLVYDVARERVVLAAAASFGDTAPIKLWEWDGERWSALDAVRPPPARSRFSLGYDVAGKRLVLTGGFRPCGQGASCDVSFQHPARNEEVWSLDSERAQVPAIRVSLDRTKIGLTNELGGGEITSFSTFAWSGGSGRAVGSAGGAHGSRLHVWDAALGRWRAIAENEAPAAEPNELSSQSPQGADLERFVTRDQTLELAIVPRFGLGTGEQAEVALDYLELRVDYLRGRTGCSAEAGAGRPACRATPCTDPMVWNGFECSPPDFVRPEPVCGDGTVEPPEQCDDGNRINGDGCNSRCELEGLAEPPADGIVERLLLQGGAPADDRYRYDQTSYSLPCPEQEVLVGLRVQAGSWHEKLSVHCARVLAGGTLGAHSYPLSFAGEGTGGTISYLTCL